MKDYNNAFLGVILAGILMLVIGLSLLTFIRLEEFDYPAAAALAVTMLVASLALLLVVNGAQLAQERRLGHG